MASYNEDYKSISERIAELEQAEIKLHDIRMQNLNEEHNYREDLSIKMLEEEVERKKAGNQAIYEYLRKKNAELTAEENKNDKLKKKRAKDIADAEEKKEKQLLDLKIEHEKEIEELRKAGREAEIAALEASYDDLKEQVSKDCVDIINKINKEQDKAIEASDKKLEKLRKKRNANADKDDKNAEKKAAWAEHREKTKEGKKNTSENAAKLEGAFAKDPNKGLIERFSDIKSSLFLTADEKAGGANAGGAIQKTLATLTTTMGNLAKALDGTITQIADAKQTIDTRLQDSAHTWQNMSDNVKDAMGASPYVKQEKVIENLKTMISKGIAYNVEERAFLETVKDGIASTFDANEGYLTRLIRIQQQDSTAARLGMESAITGFLNEMYETTEYISDVMDSVQSSLEEAEALMSKTEATALEYQVNKWLGSMYSVGVSRDTTSRIGSAIGQLAAGQLESITGGDTGNLLAMAASNGGISLADALKDGLDESSTNKLMKSMVEYLSSIYEETKDNKVVQQQYASVFGLKASDLKAIANLASNDINNVYNNKLSYNDALARLNTMGTSYGSRMSLGQKLENATANLKYTMAEGIASNPALYTTYKIGGLINDYAGGMEFSLPMVMGTGTAQTFSVGKILQGGALGGSILSGLGSIISSLGDIASGSGITGMLSRFGGSSTTTVSRGNGSGGGGVAIKSGEDTSASGYRGNGEGGDVYDKIMSDTKNESAQKVNNVEDENAESDLKLKDVNESVVRIASLLENMAEMDSLRVTIKSLDNGLGWTKELVAPSTGSI